VPDGFSTLEKNILKAKGLTDAQIAALQGAGVGSRGDLATIGDSSTLIELAPEIAPDTADKVMRWATGRNDAASPGPSVPPANVVIDTADVVYCVHCHAKQPKDYKSGDLCVACGRQAEPILTCFWCAASGPGKFCRACGARFVPTAELDLAILLRREGLPKDEIPPRLESMTAPDKDQLWGRVRRSRA
jgi:hypothetical protein